MEQRHATGAATMRNQAWDKDSLVSSTGTPTMSRQRSKAPLEQTQIETQLDKNPFIKRAQGKKRIHTVLQQPCTPWSSGYRPVPGVDSERVGSVAPFQAEQPGDSDEDVVVWLALCTLNRDLDVSGEG